MSSLAGMAVKMLRGRRALVVGDSIAQQWANALLLDLHGRALLFPPRGAWRNAVTNLGDDQARWKRMYCGSEPTLLFNASAMSSSRSHPAPIIAVAIMHEDSCRMAKIDKPCCIGAGPPLAYLQAVLRSLQPQIVVANYGVHWHGRQTSRAGTYARHITRLLDVLTNYSMQRRLQTGRRPLVVLRETLPQHFQTAWGDGAWDGPEQTGDCGPIKNRKPNAGPRTFNLLAERAVRMHPHGVHVELLKGEFDAMLPRHDAHHQSGDCTHFCYAPLLWEPALRPFYMALLRWRQQAFR